MYRAGFIEEDGVWYYYEDGNKVINGWREVDSRWYYLDKDGKMVTGWFQTVSDGDRWFYAYPKTIDKDGTRYYKGEMATGWIYVNDAWYYCYPGKTEKDGNTRYKGEMATGWIQLDNKWYYLQSNGTMVQKSSRTIDNVTYTFNESGVMEEDIVSLGQLKALGFKNAEGIIDDLNRCCKKFDITTTARLRHFISQCGHESGGGIYIQELASGDAYEGRKDLGNTQKGDGRKYKGAGFIQLTGRTNYQSFANYVGDQRVMEGVSYVSVKYPWTSAGWFWMSRDFNSKVDSGYTVEQITRIVNGGYNGLSDRKYWYNKCCEVFK